MNISSYLLRDNAGPLSLAVRDPRWTLANSVSSLGGALARLGHRIHRDVPSDYFDGFSEGQKMAAVVVAATEGVKRERAVQLAQRLGFDTGPKFMALMGWND